MKYLVIDLPPELHDALEHIAGRDEIVIGTIVRDALRKDLRQRAAMLNRRAHQTTEVPA
jgi:hypothetical protein